MNRPEADIGHPADKRTTPRSQKGGLRTLAIADRPEPDNAILST